MPTYSICNIALESDLCLPELEGAKGHTPGIRFLMSCTALSDGEDCEWLHTWTLPDGTPWLTIGRQPRGYLLRFQAMVDFAVLRDAQEILCYAPSDTPSETIRHLLLDQVLPLVLSWRGQLVVHGSAVLTPEGTVAFVGDSGSGKSTLASSFSGDGMAVLTDDCLLLEEDEGRLTAIPSYPGVRLWPDAALNIFRGEPRPWTEVAHYTGKKRLAANAGIRFCTWPTELLRVYFLSAPKDNATLRVEPLTPRETMLELVKYSYLIDASDRLRLRQDFERLGRFAVKPCFYRLAYSHDFSQLAEVRHAIIRSQPSTCEIL